MPKPTNRISRDQLKSEIAKAKQAPRYNEQEFFKSLKEAGLPIPKKEWQFHYERQWKLDYAWPDPDIMLALEVEGGLHHNGGRGGYHNSPEGFKKDLEKYNAAAAEGFRMVRFTPSQMNSRKTIEIIKEAYYG